MFIAELAAEPIAFNPDLTMLIEPTIVTSADAEALALLAIVLIDTLTALRASARTATPTAARPTIIPNNRNMIPPAIAIAPAPISIAPVPSAIVPNANIATPSAIAPTAAITHAAPTSAIPPAACMPY